jgi:hypothetical protein
MGALAMVSVGEAYGSLVVRKALPSSLQGREWLCQCACRRLVARASTELRRGRRLTCGACSYGADRRSTAAPRWEELVDRFVAGLDTGAGRGDCWKRIGLRGEAHVVNIGVPHPRSISGFAVPAHHVSWEAFNGPIAPGLVVLHLCDNGPLCVNPDHLALGTQAANVFDMMRKGRGRWPGKLGEHVPEIRRRAADGESPESLASAFGVSPLTIRRAVNGQTWRRP